VIFHVKDGEVEHDLLSSLDLDDPGAFPTMVVIVWPAGRVKNATAREVVATAS
jgi:hypothetical protein